ncbi:transposase [Streptomyces hundungensis]|uniref:transposase n=1 Tax=Streptomyces hundungensis TaxID=1077946 RepID=UPI0034077FD0
MTCPGGAKPVRVAQSSGSDNTDTVWVRPELHLPRSAGPSGSRRERRQAIEGILFRERPGLPWRNLPAGSRPLSTAVTKNDHRVGVDQHCIGWVC